MLQRREVLHGQLWFAQPAVVVHDDGDVLGIRVDGTREWKDVTDLHHQRIEGRITEQTVIDVLCAAAGVEDALPDGDHWWRDWDDWTLENVPSARAGRVIPSCRWR